MNSRHLALVALLVAFTQCKKDEPAKVIPIVAPVIEKAKPETAEVEFNGSWSTAFKDAATHEFIAQKEPCLPVIAQPTNYGHEKLTGEGRFFAEFFIAQGAEGHLCINALDAAGKVLGVGAFAKNPVKFEGKGEVIFDDVDIKVEPPKAQ